MKKFKFTVFCLTLFVAFMMASCKNIFSDDQKSLATSSASFKFPDDISARLEAAREATGETSDSSYLVTVELTGDYDYSASIEKTFTDADSIKNATFAFNEIKVGYVVKASVTITYGGIELFSGESDEIEIAEDSSKNNLKVTLTSHAAPFEIRFYYSDAPTTYYTASDTLVPYRFKDATETAAATTLTFAIFKDGEQYTGSDFTATWKLNDTTVASSEDGSLTLADGGLSFTASSTSFDTTKADTVSCSITKELYTADLTPLSFTFTEDLDTYNRYLLMRSYTNSNFTAYYYYNVFDSAGSEEAPLSEDNAKKSIGGITSGTVGMDSLNLNLYQLESSSTDSVTTTKLTVIPYLLLSHAYSETTSEIALGSLDISNINFISAYNSNIALYKKGGYFVNGSVTNGVYIPDPYSLGSTFYYCKNGGTPVLINVQSLGGNYANAFVTGLSVQKDGIYVLAGYDSDSSSTSSNRYFTNLFILKYPLDATSSSVPKVLDVTNIIPCQTITGDSDTINSYPTIKDAVVHGDYLYVIGGYYLPSTTKFVDETTTYLGGLTRGFMFRVKLSDSSDNTSFTIDTTFGTNGVVGYEAYSDSSSLSTSTNFYYPVRFVAVTPKKLVIADAGGYYYDSDSANKTFKRRLITYSFTSDGNGVLSAEDIVSDNDYLLNDIGDCSYTDNY